MYAGLFITKHSGNWLGAHQKFNRVAYRLTLPYIQYSKFPSLKGILHFEGVNGPDALKPERSGYRKPSHFYHPEINDGPVLEWIDIHFNELVKALKAHDSVRCAFEAAWLAHAVTDGLTPAHHYPYVERMEQIHDEAEHTVQKPSDKILVSAPTKRQAVKQTWKLIGAKGLMSTHQAFEIGVAATISAFRFNNLYLLSDQIAQASQLGRIRFFKSQAQLVAHLNMYERFAKTGWTIGLARQIKHVLAPIIIETIATIWLLAYQEAYGSETGNEEPA